MNCHIVANRLSYGCQFIIIYMVMDWHQVINKYLMVVGLLISELIQSHKHGIFFFVTVEMDCVPVVSHFRKDVPDGFLLVFRDDTPLLFDAIVDCCAKCVHYFVSDVTHVGYPHVVVNVRYAPCETFLAVEFE